MNRRVCVDASPVTVIEMRHLFFLCTIISVSGSDYLDTFRKCCPKGQGLIKVIDSYSSEEYQCFDSAFEKMFKVKPPTSTVFATENVAVEYGIPNECDLELINFDDNVIHLSDKENHCYDRLVIEVINGTVKQIIPKTVALVCTGTDIAGGTDMKIQSLRKCCESGQMYDTEHHQCRNVKEYYDDQWFIKQLKVYGGKVFELEIGLYCKSVEYDVQLKEKMFSLSLEGSTLSILSRSSESGGVLSPLGNWCVDRELTTGKLMARTCTQDCSSLGAYCIKKCCPVGQHYKPFHCGSARSACVPTSGDDALFSISEYLDPVKETYGVGGEINIAFVFEYNC